MARVEVDRDDYVDATLPRVCALTGGDADDWVRAASRRLPDWWPLLLLLGAPGLAAIAVIYGLRETIAGWLPVDAAAWQQRLQYRRAQRRRVLHGLGWSVGVPVALALVLATSGALPEALPVAVLPWLAVFVVATGGALVLLLIPDAWLTMPRVNTLSGGRVQADDVHPDFVAAVHEQRRARRWRRAEDH